MAGQYLGEIAPIYGRWVWPTKQMAVGDWFHVDHSLKHPESVRNYISVRAAQLGIRLSVMANDPDHPGFCKVTRIDWSQPGEVETPSYAQLDYEKAGFKFAQWYGFDIQNVPAGSLHHHGRAVVEVRQLEAPAVKRLVFPFPPHDRVGAVFFKDRIEFEVLPASVALDRWAKSEPSLADVMG